MAKKSGYLMRMQAQRAVELKRRQDFAIQWAADAAILAANEVFQRRGEKLVEFNNSFVRWAHEIARTTLEDARDDKSLEYTKAKLDERMQELLGDAFVPWEERYRM